MPAQIIHHADPTGIGQPVPASALTRCEREIATQICLGYRSDEIAAKRCSSKRTVDFHIANIYQKLHLGANNRVRLMQWADASGLIPHAAHVTERAVCVHCGKAQ